MLTQRRLLEIARKWKKMAALGRKRITWKKKDTSQKVNARRSSVAERGHFVLYSLDGKRFMVPIKFLHTGIFEELLRISEEVFGLPRDGPITIPCDAVFLEYLFSLLKKGGSEDKDRELQMSSFIRTCSRSPLCNVGHSQELAVF